MKDSLSNSQRELEQRKQVFESAKKVRKHAKAAYEAEVKAFKAHLKSFKQMYKQAVAAEKDARKAYKALQKGLNNFEKEISLIEELVNEDLTMPTELQVKEKSPKAKKSKQNAAGVQAQPKKKTDRPAKATKTVTAKKGRPKAATSGGDDLTKVKGVGDIVADMLKANGVTTFADMAATSFDRYKELLKANGMSQFRNPTTWAAQAAALAEAPASEAAPKASPKPKGPAKKTGAAPKTTGKPGRPKTQKVETAKPAKAPVSKAKAATGGDDLTKVKGVGDIVADMLKANGVTTFADMAATSFDRYKELLKANGLSQFRNPTTWAAQAAALAGTTGPVAEKKAPKQASAKSSAKPKAEKTTEPAKKASPKVTPKPKAKAAPASGASADGSDDLSKIKGIGGRVAEVLNDNGIRSYADVAATSVERFKEILKENDMSRFRDPSNWAEQAAELLKAG